MPSSIIVAAISSAVSAILPASISAFASKILLAVIGTAIPAIGDRKPHRRP